MRRSEADLPRSCLCQAVVGEVGGAFRRTGGASRRVGEVSECSIVGELRTRGKSCSELLAQTITRRNEPRRDVPSRRGERVETLF